MSTSSRKHGSRGLLSPQVRCANCGRVQNVGNRWGSETRDAHFREYCTLECAWTTMFVEEAAARAALAPPAAAPPAPRRSRPPRRSGRRRSSKRAPPPAAK